MPEDSNIHIYNLKEHLLDWWKKAMNKEFSVMKYTADSNLWTARNSAMER
jgi:hypothetical protein